MFKKFILPISFLCFANPISAKTPQVATDIPPVHSLVAMVMDGVATPGLIMAPGASPHGYSMRPSEAALLEGADVVIWIGEELTPWLEDARGSLADNAENIVLLDVADTHLHAFREDAVFEHHDDHEEDGHDEDGHKEDEHGHDDHGHDHGDIDPHAWLDPENAQIWLGEIAAALSRLDPENSDRYLSNAEAGKARINEVASEAITKLKPVSGEGFVVFHDSIHWVMQRNQAPPAFQRSRVLSKTKGFAAFWQSLSITLIWS